MGESPWGLGEKTRGKKTLDQSPRPLNGDGVH